MSGKRKTSVQDDDLFDEESSDFVSDLRTMSGGSGSSERTSSFSEDPTDYDSVSSPGGSSTASGPTYIRPAGFEHHAQEVVATPPKKNSPAHKAEVSSIGRSNSVISRHSLSALSLGGSVHATPLKGGVAKKKKSLLSADYKDGSVGVPKRIEGVSVVSRPKHKKDPLPMKQRALPQSFWQEPNAANPQSPGIIYSNFPPLLHDDTSAAPITPVEDVGPRIPPPDARVVSVANTDLLFSLFNSVEEEEAQRRIHVVRRGRPKKVPLQQSYGSSRIIRDDDPCLNSTAAESILPLIPERGVGGSVNNNNNNSTSGSSVKGSQGTQVIRIMSISNGDRSVELPSLNVEHNYPHLLSELVMKL